MKPLPDRCEFLARMMRALTFPARWNRVLGNAILLIALAHGTDKQTKVRVL